MNIQEILQQHPPALYALCTHLPLISILSLKRAFDLRRLNAHWWATVRYCAYLKRQGVTDDAIEILFQCNIAFSGSTVLKVLQGADWDCNDLDVIEVDQRECPRVFEHPVIVQNLYSADCLVPNIERDAEDESTYLVNLHDYSEPYEDCVDLIADVTQYHVRDMASPVLQIIRIVVSYDEYVHSFDLDACANYLTPNRLVVKHPHAVLKGEIAGDTQASETRLLKYEARGFAYKVTI